MATFRFRLAALLVVVTLCTSCQALECLNKGSRSIVVFVPPICAVCKCPTRQCIRAPCPQPKCFCPRFCKYVPGLEIQKNARKTLTVEKTAFPLAFLTVEIGKVTYVVNAKDLEEIAFIARVVVTGKACGKGKQQGIEALVFPNPQFYPRFYKFLCLLRGDGSDLR